VQDNLYFLSTSWSTMGCKQ